MDPLSVTASAIAILQISGVIITTCYDYRSRVKDSAKDASRIINELNALRSVIESLFVLLEDEPEKKLSEQSNLQKLAKVDGVLETCKADLEALGKKLEPREGWRAVRAAILWPLTESDTVKALHNIDRTKSSLQLALVADQRKTTLNIQRGVESLTEQFQSSISNARREKILQWLSATNSTSAHSVARRRCQDMTGLWLIEGELFSRWSSSPMSFLWIYGIPGCGKTILASTIIDTLRERYPTPEEAALAYFYFDFNESQKGKADSLIRSLVAQLYGQASHTPAGLEKLYNEFQNTSFQPPLASLVQVLSQIITCFPKVYIIIDALDECEELDEILDILRVVQGWKENRLRTIVASRDLVDIRNSLSQVVTDTLCVETSNIGQDISIYIAERLEVDSRLVRWPPEIRDMIRKTLMDKAHGMFRWIECQLDSLRNCHTIKDLKKDLDTLPKTLEETYERILLRIDERDREAALKLLRWVCFASRPITLKEATEVLAINADEQPCYDPDLKPLDPQDTMFLCSTLLTKATIRGNSDIRAYEGGYYSNHVDTQLIRLAHLSVKDYLISDRIKSSRLSFFALDTQLANTTIARSCLFYLLQPSLEPNHRDKVDLRHRLNKWPLYNYAANFWPFHVKESAHDDLEHSTWKLLNQFLSTRNTPNGGHYLAWIIYLTPGISTEVAKRTHPIYYAASFGIKSLVRHFIITDPELDINATGGRFDSTALQVAVYRKHPDVVKLLLEAKADPNIRNSLGESCMQWAVTLRNKELQGLLKRYGAWN